jgi:hypothetical protein
VVQSTAKEQERERERKQNDLGDSSLSFIIWSEKAELAANNDRSCEIVLIGVE